MIESRSPLPRPPPQVLFPLCCSFVVDRAQKRLRAEDLVKGANGEFPDGGDPDEIYLRQLPTQQVSCRHITNLKAMRTPKSNPIECSSALTVN